MRYYYTVVSMVKIQNTTTKVAKHEEQQELSYIAGRNAKTVQTVRQFLIKLNILLPCDPEVVLLGIYPK